MKITVGVLRFHCPALQAHRNGAHPDCLGSVWAENLCCEAAAFFEAALGIWHPRDKIFERGLNTLLADKPK